MASDQIDWPDQTQPGVPLNPNKRGWHWLGFKGQHEAEREPWAWLWSDEDGATGEFGWMTDDDGDPERMARHHTYIAPIATPADLAARVEAERVALRRVLAKIGTEDDHYSTPTMDRLEARGRKNAVREIHEAIRALGPTPAFDAAIKAAREDGMEAAAKWHDAEAKKAGTWRDWGGPSDKSLQDEEAFHIEAAAAIRAAKDQPA